MTKEQIMQVVARGWCHKKNSSKTMDTDLAMAITDEIIEAQDKSILMDKLKVFLRNLKHIHHTMMMRYLQKRNWVVFYLEPEHRICDNECCWLKLYESEQKRKK